jgi:hypothetical protein
VSKPRDTFDGGTHGWYWCVPTAIAVAADVTYSEAEQAIRNAERKWGFGRNREKVTRVSHLVTQQALLSLGIRQRQLEPPTDLAARYAPFTFTCRVWRAIARGLFKGGTFRLTTGSHTFLVREYMVFDNCTRRWAWFGDYHYGRARLMAAWRLEGLHEGD